MTIRSRDPSTHVRSQKVPVGASMAVESAKEETDINNIMRRFNVHGVVPQRTGGQYIDVSEIGDYQQCLEVVQEAERQFLAIPSEIRRKFDNDPRQMIDFLIDPDNIDEARQMGLFEPLPPEPEPLPPEPEPLPPEPKAPPPAE